MNDVHLADKPVSASTYKRYGCRCDACTAAATAYMRQMRSARGGALLKVQQRRQTLAVAWLRREHPDVWAELHQQAYDELGIERRGSGRPKAEAS